MAGIIQAVFTQDTRRIWPQFLLPMAFPAVQSAGHFNRLFFSLLSFKVGEGGWVSVGGGGKAPRTPDPTLRRTATDPTAPNIQDLDALVDPFRPVIDQRYTGTGAAYSRATFEKALVASDMTFVSPSTLRVRCFLDLAEFNNDGFGNNPELWEIGLFGPLQGGSSAAIASIGPVVVTGLTGMVASDVGGTLTLVNSSIPGNNNTFNITTFINSTSVEISGGAVDAGPLQWAVSTRKLMIAYGTFPEVIKTASRQDESFIDLTF